MTKKKTVLEDVFDSIAGEYSVCEHTIYNPIRYILKIPGKRIRPLLVAFGYLLGRKGENNGKTLLSKDAVLLAEAVEVFHNFSLMHDDLMDESPLRRGVKTVHLKWSKNSAILSGDAMMLLAYKKISEIEVKNISDIYKEFTKMGLLVCEGQQEDMDMEGEKTVSREAYIEMIRKKTSVLLGSSLKLGYMLGVEKKLNKKEFEIANLLYSIGEGWGLAFQLQDDLLDSFPIKDKGVLTEFGKRVGGDISQGKKTALYIEALDSLQNQKRTVNNISLENFIIMYNKKELSTEEQEDKINKITEIFQYLKVEKTVDSLAKNYYKTATKELKKLPFNNKKDVIEAIEEFVESLQVRKK